MFVSTGLLQFIFEKIDVILLILPHVTIDHLPLYDHLHEKKAETSLCKNLVAHCLFNTPRAGIWNRQRDANILDTHTLLTVTTVN